MSIDAARRAMLGAEAEYSRAKRRREVFQLKFATGATKRMLRTYHQLHIAEVAAFQSAVDAREDFFRLGVRAALAG